mgnify:CR=1 FL=1
MVGSWEELSSSSDTSADAVVDAVVVMTQQGQQGAVERQSSASGHLPAAPQSAPTLTCRSDWWFLTSGPKKSSWKRARSSSTWRVGEMGAAVVGAVAGLQRWLDKRYRMLAGLGSWEWDACNCRIWEAQRFGLPLPPCMSLRWSKEPIGPRVSPT